MVPSPVPCFALPCWKESVRENNSDGVLLIHHRTNSGFEEFTALESLLVGEKNVSGVTHHTIVASCTTNI